MKYPFNPIERRVYPKTFLKDVRLAVYFVPVDFSSVDKEQIKQFFDQFKGASIDVTKLPEGIELQSQDNYIRLNFSLASVEVMLRQPYYKKFEQAESFLGAISKFLEILSVRSLQKLSISKYNELKFQQSSEDYPILNIMKGVFSEELLNKMGAENNSFENMVRWEKALSFDGSEETGTLFYAECGFCKTEPNSLKGSLALTTRVESSIDVNVEKLIDTARFYNQILDESFHWCVTKEIIEKMSES